MSEKKETKGWYYKWKEEQRKAVFDWWVLLTNREIPVQRANRAKLRRCRDPYQVLLEPAFYSLKARCDSFYPNQAMGLAMIGGLLAHVKEHQKGRRFGQQLGQSKEGSDTPVMSELRFSQLQKARQPDDVYRFLRRAVLLLNRQANVVSLAEFILAWDLDYRFKRRLPNDPSQRLQFKFASDYYLKNQK